jgi:superoxide dismutase
MKKDKKSREIGNGRNTLAPTYACHVKTLSENTNAIKKNKETQLETSIKVGIKLSTDKTNHMGMSRKQNAGKIRNSMTTYKSFEQQIKIAFKKKLRADKIRRNLQFFNRIIS